MCGVKEEGLVAVSLAVAGTESFPTFFLTTGTSEVPVKREKQVTWYRWGILF